MPEFIVTASPRQRWALSMLLFNPELKFKGRTQEKRLYRARRDLGLLQPSEAFLTYNQNLNAGDTIRIGPGAFDAKTRHAFTVTEETRDFMVEIIEKVHVTSGDLLWLEPLLSCLDDKAESPDAATAPRYAPSEDVDRWRPLAEPPDDAAERQQAAE